jgi:hypothetical protein
LGAASVVPVASWPRWRPSACRPWSRAPASGARAMREETCVCLACVLMRVRAAVLGMEALPRPARAC